MHLTGNVKLIVLFSGHTVSKTSVDTTITSKRQAFGEGLSTGAKSSISKGRRLFVVHMGNENGFVEGADEVFESKNTGDYLESMDANRFEQWFENILPKLGENAVVVLDNAPYHCRRQEKTPTTAWSKTSVQEWLRNKELSYDENDVKAELLKKVNNVKADYQRYAVDELAKKFKVEVLRLPPYHFELNPIELVWADIKGHVARNNTTFKFEDVKKLLQEGIQRISPDKWRNCVDHVIKVEDNFYNKIDNMIDNTIDSFIINIADADSSTESFLSSTDDSN